MKLTIPASVLVDVLAGRKGLLDSYGGEDEQVTNWLRQGCRIVACRFIDGDVERAESGKVELEFAPPHEPVYWGESV